MEYKYSYNELSNIIHKIERRYDQMVIDNERVIERLSTLERKVNDIQVQVLDIEHKMMIERIKL